MECLDSDALIGVLRNSPGAKELSEKLDEKGKAATTSVNAYEILLGAKRVDDKNKLEEARKLLGKLVILYFDERAAEKSSEIHAELSKTGAQLDLRDIFIGSIAFVNGCSIVTRNTKHFSKIKELKIEKW